MKKQILKIAALLVFTVVGLSSCVVRRDRGYDHHDDHHDDHHYEVHHY